MSLIARRRPSFNREFTGIRHAMDRFFDDSPLALRSFVAPRRRLTNAEAIATLPIDISEVDSDTIVRASVPGFSAEEIDVTVEDGVLTISAKHDEPSEESDEHYSLLPTRASDRLRQSSHLASPQHARRRSRSGTRGWRAHADGPDAGKAEAEADRDQVE